MITSTLPKRLSVDVLKADIKYGVKGNNSSCPVARALKRKFRGAKVKVGCYSAFVSHKGDAVSYDLSKKAQNFVSRFDWDLEVKPVTISMVHGF